jgi:hypothetical protein
MIMPFGGEYLAKRAGLIADLAAHVRGDASERSPPCLGYAGQSAERRPRRVKSTYGGPLTASTRRTTDPPEQDKCRPLPPSGKHHLDRSVADCSDDLSRLDVRAHRAASRDRRHEDQQHVPRPPATRPS